MATSLAGNMRSRDGVVSLNTNCNESGNQTVIQISDIHIFVKKIKLTHRNKSTKVQTNYRKHRKKLEITEKM